MDYIIETMMNGNRISAVKGLFPVFHKHGIEYLSTVWQKGIKANVTCTMMVEVDIN